MFRNSAGDILLCSYAVRICLGYISYHTDFIILYRSLFLLLVNSSYIKCKKLILKLHNLFKNTFIIVTIWTSFYNNLRSKHHHIILLGYTLCPLKFIVVPTHPLQMMQNLLCCLTLFLKRFQIQFMKLNFVFISFTLKNLF